MGRLARDRQHSAKCVSFDVAISRTPARAGPATRGARLFAACALLWTLGACGTRTSVPGSDPFQGGAAPQQIRLNVRNNNFYDATLTAIADSGRRRLGTVGGNQSAVFAMPLSFVSGLRIEIDLLAGGSCTTDFITVSPGETVELEISADLDSSPNCR